MPFSLTPKDSSFYDMFTASAENLVAATDVLSEFIHDHARRPELADKLRDLEHAADQTTHAIFRQLNTSFVTPFDREDIYNLASDLDDVMDYVEAAADLVVLTQLLGLSYAEAAEVAGCPVGTIRSRVARARGDLVASLGRVKHDDHGSDAAHA